MTPLDVAKKIAGFAVDKKAEHIVVLSMSGVANFCDYFVICTGTGSRHVKAIADGVDEGLHELGIKIKFKQGLETAGRRSFSFSNPMPVPEESTGRWILLDMGDVVTHIFEGDSREFYGLEHLWQEARVIDWQK